MNEIISPYELLNDSVMSKDEIIKYIKDDFRTNLNDLYKITIYKYKQEMVQKCSRISHHRYNLYYCDGNLIIMPFEGALRINHIITEIRILEAYLNKKISIEIIDDNITDSKELDNAIVDIKSKIGKNDLLGVIIGSLSNVNFFVNYRVDKKRFDTVINKFSSTIIDRYVSHRLRVSDIETSYINGESNDVDSSIFQEGAIPTQEMYDYVERFYYDNKIAHQYSIIDYDVLYKYLALDYIYFNDLNNGTNVFNSCTQFNETQIFSNKLLTYQIITTPQKNGIYLNISWIEPTVLGYVLKELQKEYCINKLLMYGKCGSLIESVSVGSIVAPKSIYKNGIIPINNCFGSGQCYDFISVETPLFETKKWLKDTVSLGISCVEMELADIFERIRHPEFIDIGYYISDNLTSNLKLSNRFDFLYQRLFLSGRIVNCLL